MEIENLSKITYFYVFSSLYIFFKKHFLSTGEIKIAVISITIWLTFLLYSKIFQLYIELTGLALREVQYMITSNFPT